MKKYIILFFSIFLFFVSCIKSVHKHQKSNKSNGSDFMVNFKEITKIKNLRNGELKNYHFLIDKKDTLTESGINFYRFNVSEHSDSLYIGFKNKIVYFFDSTINYFDKSLILKLNRNTTEYHSFLFGFDYLVNNVSISYNSFIKDSLFVFEVSKLKGVKGSDFFIYSHDDNKDILEFKKIFFSKSYGIIKAVLYNKFSKENYVTISPYSFDGADIPNDLDI